MIFDFKGTDTCAAPKEIDLLVKALSIDEILPLAERWFEYNGRRSVKLVQMDYIRAANISANWDKLRFDATFDCRLSNGDVKRLTFRGMMVCEEPAVWYHRVEIYAGNPKPDNDGFCRCDDNLVPIIGKRDLEAEATDFLRTFCPDALTTAQALPIERILEDKLGLVVLRSDVAANIWKNEGEQPFGQIFFTETPIDSRDAQTGEPSRFKINSGTVIVDAARTIGSEGCINNTLAHEGVHWYRHRMYAAIHNSLHHDKPFIACRKSARTPEKDLEWTDESRIEWQANSIAPRILMPKEPFKAKALEFMELRRCSPGNAAALSAVIRDLSDFFKVSRKSAEVRLKEVGLICETAGLWESHSFKLNQTTTIKPAEAFREYQANEDFRALVDTGALCYVENRFVLNDKRYITEYAGQSRLTAYARQHQQECCVTFTVRKVYPKMDRWGIAYRYDKNALKNEPKYGQDGNVSILDSVQEFQRLRELYSVEFAEHITFTKTFSDIAVPMMRMRRWNSVIFKKMTHLDDTAYSHIMNNTRKISLRTAMAFCVGIDATKTMADKLLAAAGYALTKSDEHFAFNFLLTSMKDRGIDECNAMLEDLGFEPLGCRETETARAAIR